MFDQNTLLSLAPGTEFSLFFFPFACWYTIFLLRLNNLFALYRSTRCVYVFIFWVLTSKLCFSSSIATWRLFLLLSIYFSISVLCILCIFSLPIFCYRMLIRFLISSIDCFTLLFHHSSCFFFLLVTTIS